MRIVIDLFENVVLRSTMFSTNFIMTCGVVPSVLVDSELPDYPQRSQIKFKKLFGEQAIPMGKPLSQKFK